jgi:hypothetical protein
MIVSVVPEYNDQIIFDYYLNYRNPNEQINLSLINLLKINQAHIKAILQT